jgi:hypothetical protein
MARGINREPPFTQLRGSNSVGVKVFGSGDVARIGHAK